MVMKIMIGKLANIYNMYIYTHLNIYIYLYMHHVSKFYLRMLERVKVMLIN